MNTQNVSKIDVREDEKSSLKENKLELKESVFIAYADVDATVLFDFRGCIAPSLEELEKSIKTEIKKTLKVDDRTLDDIYMKIYYKDLKEISIGVSCDAIVIVKYRTMNRNPRYIKEG